MAQGKPTASAHRDKAGRPVIAVTGMGVITSLGVGKTDNWTKLTAGKSGIRRISRFPLESLRTTIAGTVDDVYKDYMPPAELSERIAMLAGEEAIAQSGIGGSHFPGPLFLALPPLEIEWPYRIQMAERAAPSGDAGYPDITAVRRDRILFIELKVRAGLLQSPSDRIIQGSDEGWSNGRTEISR